MKVREKLIKDLKEIRELLTPEDHWIQGVMARDISGERVSILDLHKAKSYCLYGAVFKVAGLINTTNLVVSLRETLQESDVNLPLTEFNDKSTHQEVLGLIDRTVEKEQEYDR